MARDNIHPRTVVVFEEYSPRYIRAQKRRLPISTLIYKHARSNWDDMETVKRKETLSALQINFGIVDVDFQDLMKGVDAERFVALSKSVALDDYALAVENETDPEAYMGDNVPRELHQAVKDQLWSYFFNHSKIRFKVNLVGTSYRGGRKVNKAHFDAGTISRVIEDPSKDPGSDRFGEACMKVGPSSKNHKDRHKIFIQNRWVLANPGGTGTATKTVSITESNEGELKTAPCNIFYLQRVKDVDGKFESITQDDLDQAAKENRDKMMKGLYLQGEDYFHQ